MQSLLNAICAILGTFFLYDSYNDVDALTVLLIMLMISYFTFFAVRPHNQFGELYDHHSKSI